MKRLLYVGLFLLALFACSFWVLTQDQAILTTPQPTPTNLPPQQAAQAVIQRLIEAEGIQVRQLTRAGDTLTVDVTTHQERVGATGAVVGSVVAAYEAGGAQSPRMVVIQFRQGQVIEMRVQIRYADALSFLNGSLTAAQFASRWTVE